MRRIFVLMNEVMQRTGWTYREMMLCIYGLAGAGELDEKWVENWLERQLVICEKIALYWMKFVQPLVNVKNVEIY